MNPNERKDMPWIIIVAIALSVMLAIYAVWPIISQLVELFVGIRWWVFG